MQALISKALKALSPAAAVAVGLEELVTSPWQWGLLKLVATCIASICAWWLLLCYWWLVGLSRLKRPISGLAIMPADFLAVEPTDSSAVWKFVRRLLGLPIRLGGFAYAFGDQNVYSHLTGSEILNEAHNQLGECFQYAAYSRTIVSVRDAHVAKACLSALAKDSSSNDEGGMWAWAPVLSFFWKFVKKLKNGSLIVMPSGPEVRPRTIVRQLPSSFVVPSPSLPLRRSLHPSLSAPAQALSVQAMLPRGDGRSASANLPANHFQVLCVARSGSGDRRAHLAS